MPPRRVVHTAGRNPSSSASPSANPTASSSLAQRDASRATSAGSDGNQTASANVRRKRQTEAVPRKANAAAEHSGEKAPVELVGEFVTQVMAGEYQRAAALCRQILILEPNNATALEFQSVLAEKQALDLEDASDDSDDQDDDSGASGSGSGDDQDGSSDDSGVEDGARAAAQANAGADAGRAGAGDDDDSGDDDDADETNNELEAPDAYVPSGVTLRAEDDGDVGDADELVAELRGLRLKGGAH